MKTFNEKDKSGYSGLNEDNLHKHNLTALDEAEYFDNGPESPDERLSNRAVKGVAWLAAIFGIFAIGILLAWICNIDHSPSQSYSARATVQRPIMSSPTYNPSADPGKYMTLYAPESNFNSFKTKVAAKENLIAIPAVITVQKIKLVVDNLNPSVKINSTASTAKSTAVGSESDKDRIEREALEVIHGDFGNNPSREIQLGPDYAAVQARVNEILHSHG